jgi:hypothetical protein
VVIYYFDLDGTDTYLVSQQLLFAFGMSIFFLADRITINKHLFLSAKINVPKIVFWATVVATIYILFTYKDNLQFVAFEDVYELRLANNKLGSDTVSSYLLAWLSNVLIPICLGYGLFCKKKSYFVLATIASIIIYMSTGAKSVLLFPLITYLLYSLLKNKDLSFSFTAIGLGLIVVMLITLSFELNIYSSLFWMRLIGNSGSLTKHYHDFFQDHPLTYMSHVNVVRAIGIDYPYGNNALGQIVGREYYSEDMNANANFWATDGYAAFGNIGIISSSITMFFVLVCFNFITKTYNKLFITLILIPYLTSLLNTSLFSSLLTGGGFIIFFLLSFEGFRNNKYLRSREFRHSRD